MATMRCPTGLLAVIRGGPPTDGTASSRPSFPRLAWLIQAQRWAGSTRNCVAAPSMWTRRRRAWGKPTCSRLVTLTRIQPHQQN